MLPRKNTRDIFPFWESDILLRNGIFERQKQAQRTDIDEASVRKAVSGIGADICEGRPIEEYKKLFSAFVERVDVFDMINVRVCNGSGVIKEEPPLDLHFHFLGGMKRKGWPPSSRWPAALIRAAF